MAVPGGPHQSPVLDCTVFARVQACRIHDCTVFTRLQGLMLQKIQKNSMKNAGWEFIPGSRGSPGSSGNGVSRRSSEPPFHAQESQDDVSSQANSLKLVPISRYYPGFPGFSTFLIFSMFWGLFWGQGGIPMDSQRNFDPDQSPETPR